MQGFKDYWWVNHNQTYESEIKGYMWSPKRKKNGGRNQFYDNMTEVAVGDAVFSFAHSHVKAVGIVDARAITRDRPREFDAQWDLDGWYVGVNWSLLKNPFRPRNYINVLRPLLPNKYSPLDQNGDGLQGVYLAHLGESLGGQLLKICIDLNPELVIDLQEVA